MKTSDFLSIGISAHNEEAGIDDAVRSILNNTLWGKMKGKRELIVHADGCTDSTAKIVRGIQRDHPDVRLVETKKMGKAHSRELLTNEMNEEAEFQSYVDGDVIVPKDTLEQLHNTLKRYKDIHVATAMPVPEALFEVGEKGWFTGRSIKEYKKRTRDFDKRLGRGLEPRIHGACYVIRADVRGGIKIPRHLRGGTDHYLTLKIGRKRIKVVKGAKVVYREPASFFDWVKRFRRYYTAKGQLEELFPGEKVPESFISGFKPDTSPRLPLNQRLTDEALHAAKVVGEILAKRDLRRLRRGKDVKWRRTRKDREKKRKKGK